jgi:hypothetical protein
MSQRARVAPRVESLMAVARLLLEEGVSLAGL